MVNDDNFLHSPALLAVIGQEPLPARSAPTREFVSGAEQRRSLQIPHRGLIRAFVVLVLAMQASFLWTIRGRIVRGDPDFTVYYGAAKMLHEGRGTELYESDAEFEVQQQFTTDSDIRRGPLPYIHPPFEALVFLPLTFLPYAAAFVMWEFVNLGMLVGIFVLLRRTLPSLRKIATADWVIVSLAFFPVFANFHQGQDAILLLLFFVLAFCALNRHADFAAGCWLGFGVLKFQFVVPVALILIFWRGRKFAQGFTFVAAAAVAVSIAMVGWHEALRYPLYAWQIVTSVHRGGLPARLMPNLVGLVGGWPVVEDWGLPLRALAAAGSLGLLVMLAAMKDRVRESRRFNLGFAGAVIVSLIASYNTNTYDLALLILPLALLVNYCLLQPGAEPKWKTIFLPALPLLISPLWFFLWLGWFRTNLMAIFLLWWFFAIWREIRARHFDGSRTAT